MDSVPLCWILSIYPGVYRNTNCEYVNKSAVSSGLGMKRFDISRAVKENEESLFWPNDSTG